ncbi:unnamed protein product [Mytilus edulis]|uniref:Uncharacterized protein n=1 Tax=Mytilus edulis TaxID=6550 RepID=A0A8S3RYN4_MYTED|nr:unnamed protein product [Mytilus edulis]
MLTYKCHTVSFPSKKLWSVIVNQNINASEETWWSYRISCDNDFYMFRHIHSAIKPHKAWTIAKQFPELRVSAKYVIDLCSIVRYEDEHLLCDKCGKFFLNIVEHLLVSCDFIQDKRDDLWQDIININPIQFSVFMDSLSAHEFTTTILSCNTSYELENDELTFFSKTCVQKIKVNNKAKRTDNEKHWEEFKLLRKTVKTKLEEAHQNYISQLLEVDKEGERKTPVVGQKFWQYVKSKKRDSCGVAPFISNGKLMEDSKEKAEALNHQFVSVFTDENTSSQPKLNGSPSPDIYRPSRDNSRRSKKAT